MAHKRLETLKEIVLLQDKMGQYFEDSAYSVPSIIRTWAPPVDLYETEENIHIIAELPGVDEKDLKIEVRDNVITIQGQRKFSTRSGESFIQVERNYGPFQRTFRLPASVQEEMVVAEFKLGLLRIKMQKVERQGPKYIRVNVTSKGL